MRLLMLNYEFPPLGGGAPPFTRELAINLVKNREINIDSITMGFDGLPRKECASGVIIHRVPCFRSRKEICKVHEMLSYIPVAIYKAIELLKCRKYDLIHSHFIVPTGVVGYVDVASRFSLVPYIISSHGFDVPSFNPDRFVF